MRFEDKPAESVRTSVYVSPVARGPLRWAPAGGPSGLAQRQNPTPIPVRNLTGGSWSGQKTSSVQLRPGLAPEHRTPVIVQGPGAEC